MNSPPLSPTPPTETPAGPAVRHDELPVLGLVAAALTAAWLLSHLGFAWDIMWHQDVGPDTFFTAPHLMVYTGGALTGLVALGHVLVTTWRRRTANTVDRSSVPVLRDAFVAPLGVIVVGWGALTFLLAGLYDQLWHAVYGFDAALSSPPHTALAFSDIIIGAGLLVLHAMLLTRTADGDHPRWLRPLIVTTFAGTAAVCLANVNNYLAANLDIAGIPSNALIMAAWTAVVLLAAAGVTRTTGIASLVAAVYTALYAVDWFFPIVAVDAYADALGLFPRDDAVGVPLLTAVLPRFVLVAAVAVDLGLALARRRGVDVRIAVPAVAAAGTALMIVLELVVPLTLQVTDPLLATATVIACAGVGALGGWLGWLAALRLRQMPGTAHALDSRRPS